MAAETVSSLLCNGDTPQIFLGVTGALQGGDPIRITRFITFQATANATTDGSYALPLGARCIALQAFQAVAPTGTTATMQIGTTLGGSQLSVATDVKTNVNTTLPPVLGSLIPLPGTSAGGSPIFVRLNQTGPTAVGTWNVIISYIMV